MPGASSLKQNHAYGDSIYLTSEVLPLNILPSQLGNQNFKILSKCNICEIITSDSNLKVPPNYLEVVNFEKNDSGYYVHLESLNCFPFGGGGSLGLYFKKVKDSILVVDRSSSSIN